MKSYCTKCNRQTNQQVMKEEKIQYHGEDDGWWDKTNYQIIQCMGCDDISFRKLYNDISQQQHSDDDETTQELYPQRGAHSRPIEPYRGLPTSIRTIYRETIDSYNANLTLLCGVGVRAVVEAICIDKSITSGKVKTKTGGERTSKNLDGKISGLATKGFLTVDNAEVLHELRFLGNEAVHDMTQPSIEELGLAIDIIELIIENIYMMKRKALNLQQRRASRKEK
jgi:Domain of unknown function (DUF4145)